MPRDSAPSHPPMIRSDCRNSPGPIVFARHGTSVVRLRNDVIAFCSIVSGCSFAPTRCVCFFHSSTEANSPANCGSQNAMWHMRPMPNTVTSRAPFAFRAAIFAGYVGRFSFVAKFRCASGTVSAPSGP